MSSQIRIAEIYDSSQAPTQPLFSVSNTSQIRIAEVYDNSAAPTQPSFSVSKTSQIRIAEIITFPYFQLTETLSITETYNRNITFQEDLGISLNLIRPPLIVTEDIGIAESSSHRLLQEVLGLSEAYFTNFLRTLEENIIIRDLMKFGLPAQPPNVPPPEFYTTPAPFLSIGLKTPFVLTKFDKTLLLQGQIEKERRRKRFIDINRSVGVEHKSTPLWQKYADSVEATGWENVFLDKPDWLLGYMVREVFVDRNIMVLVLLRPTIEVTNLRVSNPLYCRVVAINFNTSPPTVTHLQEFPLLPEARDKFGFFTYGHGLVVGIVGNQAFGIRFGDDQTSFLRFAYIAEEFRKTNPKYPSILVVPEGFIFLPNNIFYDLETFHNLPSLQAGSDNILLPIYPSKPVVVERNVTEGQVDISRAYIWQGLAARFQEMNIEPEQGITPTAPAFKGDIFASNWVSWGLSGRDITEYLLYKYSVAFDSDQNKWVLRISKVPYSYFPFPTVGIWTYLPSDDPRWKELTLSFTGNGEVAYFSRLWNRVYRAQMSAEEPLKVTEVYAWDGLLGQFQLKTPENPLLPFVAYDRYAGKVYAVFTSIPPADPAIAIFRQTLPYSPPPAPTIVFPYNNWRVSRRPVIILRPAVYAQPQEFLLRFVPKKFVDEMEIPPEQAPGFEVFSAADRTGWYVSTDGGGTWSPMTGPVLRDNTAADILVRFQSPTALPEGGEYIVLASAYSRR
jgi:hypothetical protein